jgi:hypothetical protein
MKLDFDMLPTVPDAPPEAGPDRALDPAPPEAGRPAKLLPATDCAAEAGGDAPKPTNSPVAEPISAAATINPRLIFDNVRRTLARQACSAMVAEAGQSREDGDGRGDAEAAPPKPSATVGPDVAPDSGPEERVWSGLIVRNHS